MYAAKVRSRVYHVVASETGDHEALTVWDCQLIKSGWEETQAHRYPSDLTYPNVKPCAAIAIE